MQHYIKNLAGDLLNLEINTIVKDTTSSVKLPSTRRVALRDIAEGYRDLLVSYGLCVEANGARFNVPKGQRQPGVLRWRFGGEYSFVEILREAKRGTAYYEALLTRTTNELQVEDLKNKVKMLQRVQQQSRSIIGMFKNRRKTYDVANQADKEGHAPACNFEGVASDHHPFESQTDSHVWNNDLSLKDINEFPDIDLTPDQITLVRKAWEIGVQQVLLQTVVQIDGDVTSYMTPQFLELPDDLKRMVMNMHQDSIGSATRFWRSLFKIVSDLAGKAIDKIFDRS